MMSDIQQSPRRRWPAFIAGVIVTLILTGIVHFCLTFASGMANWGQPVVASDEAVRSRLAARGVDLPASAHHLYHSLAGFVDHNEYIAFSTAPADAMPVAMAFAQRATNSPSFRPGTKSEHSFINDGPRCWGPKWATSLWDITTVTNGQMFEMRHLFVLVDTDKSRVYISTWSE